MLRFAVVLAAVIISAMMMLASHFVVGLTYGVDISSSVSSSSFRCLKDNGIEFAIVRGYQSFGRADPEAPGNIQAAKDAGMAGVDIYAFVCRSKSASTIVSEILSNTGRGSFGKLWFDIESNPSGGCGWSGDLSSNCQYIGELIDAGRSAGLDVGIYSSVGEWEQVAGSSCTIGASKGTPIWYARYNGVKDYSDWIPFGGWSSSSIAIHQYSDSIGGLCGVSADADAIAGGAPPPSPPGPGPNPNPPPPSPSGCMQFWPGLCPGSSNCMCTTGAACLTKELAQQRNISHFKNAAGGCAGSCYMVQHGLCSGNSDCIHNTGEQC